MVRVCPDCDERLLAKTFHGVTIDACSKCAGIFFDEGEINALRLDGDQALTEVEDAILPTVQSTPHSPDGERKCPNCRTLMEKYRYLYSSPIMLDSCDHCGGVWVQDGELQAMREVLEAQSKASNKAEINSVIVATNQFRAEATVARAKRLERMMRFVGRRY